MRMRRIGDGTGLTVNLRVDGNSLGFYVDPKELKSYNKHLKENGVAVEDNENRDGYNQCDDEFITAKERNSKLMNGIRLTKAHAIKEFSLLRKKPNLFISLSFQTERITTLYFDNKERGRLMRNFTRNIHNKFPKSWFFPVVGYARNQGLHYHIPAYVPYKKYCSYNYFTAFAREKWQDQLYRTKDRDCFNIEPYDEQQFSYLMSYKKNWEYRSLRQDNEGIHLYTMLYKKNMKRFVTKRYQLSVPEFDILQRKIVEYKNLRGINPESYSRQFEYWSGRVSFLPKEWLETTIERIQDESIEFIRKELLP